MSALERVVSEGLVDLTEMLAQYGCDTAGGLLGGIYGYGADFENDVFEMNQYWWGDCTCDHDKEYMAWEKTHHHTDDCYQTVLAARDYMNSRELAREWGLPDMGSALHCTCHHEEERQRWESEHQHDSRCREILPNFAIKGTNIRIEWYKYIGRGMEIQGVNSYTHWERELQRCKDSIKVIIVPERSVIE